MFHVKRSPRLGFRIDCNYMYFSRLPISFATFHSGIPQAPRRFVRQSGAAIFRL